MRNYIAESSSFLNENFKRSNRPDGRKNRSKLVTGHEISKDKVKSGLAKAKDTAEMVVDKTVDVANLSAEKISKVTENLKSSINKINADVILNGDTSVIHKTISLMVNSAPIAITLVSPLLGALALFTKHAVGNKFTQEKRIKIYSDFKTELAVVKAKLEDLDALDNIETNPKAKQQKYALIKSKANLENSMARLNHAYMEDLKKQKESRYLRQLKYGR